MRICHCITKHCDDCRLTELLLRLCFSKSSYEIVSKSFLILILKGADVHFTFYLALNPRCKGFSFLDDT